MAAPKRFSAEVYAGHTTDALKAAGLGPGDTAKFAVSPHPDPDAVAKFVPGPKRR
jgi:hypothetical protein